MSALSPLARPRYIHFARLWGQCPVQAFGTVNGLPFYFHARFDKWTFAISASTDIDPVQVAIENAPGFRVQHVYHKRTRGRCDASFMSHAQAKVLIVCSANYYLGREQC